MVNVNLSLSHGRRPEALETRRRGHLRAFRFGLGAALAAMFALTPLRAADAAWREDMKTFRIGMIAKDGGQAVPGLSTLKRAYSQALGLPVDIFVARDYAALIDAQARSRIDYAIYSTTAYATAALLCSCVEPVASPVASDGSTGLVAILVARGGGLSDPSALGGRRIAMGPVDSVAAALLPLSSLDMGKGGAAGSGEPEFVHAGSASEAEKMLVDGSADAVFGWAPAPAAGSVPGSGGTLDRLVAAGLDPASLSVIWASRPLRYGPHALRRGLDPELRRSLVVFLTGLRDLYPDLYDLLEADHGGGFAEAGPSDYESAIDMVREAGSTTAALPEQP